MRAALPLSLLLLCAALAGARAEDARCAPLLRQEASLRSASTGTEARLAKLQQTIDSLERQSNEAIAAMRARNCDIDPDGAPECSGMNVNLSRIQRSLVYQQDLYASTASNSGRNRADERQRLLAMIEDYGCGGAASPAARAQTGAPSAADITGSVAPDAGYVGPAESASDYTSYGSEGTDTRFTSTTMRTLCVRECDGFYFPISFSTDSTHLASDARQCASRCANTSAELYVYDTYRQQPDDAVSVKSGRPLKAMPNAFRFRTTYNPSCTCQPAVRAEELAQSEGSTGPALRRLEDTLLPVSALKGTTHNGMPAKPASRQAIRQVVAPGMTVPRQTQ